MGTFNYKRSDYITMGIRAVDAWDIEHDEELMKELQAEVEEYGGTIEDAVRTYVDDCNECDYENARYIYEKYKDDLYYYHITLHSGYYDGFYFDIESNFPVAFDNWEDKRDAQKEVTLIARMLRELAGVGVVACYPNWSTSYEDYDGTIKCIKDATAEMRDNIRSTPTWSWYEAERYN